MKKILLLITLFFVSLSLMHAKDALSKKDQEEIIKALCGRIETIYPFTDIATKTINGIRGYHVEGKYSKLTDPREFSNQITTDLEDLSEDKHYHFMYNPDLASQIAMQENIKVAAESLTAIDARNEKWHNYGFKELKILEGGIGYLDLRLFFSPYYAGDIAVAAMDFFANCNAMIIDLRYNHGGWDDMVNLLLSYFTESRDGVIFNVAQQTIDSSYYAGMTSSYVPGKKLIDMPLYVLISQSTASAAEAFAARIKHVNNRAILVGGTSAGAENPVATVVIADDFILNIPSWRQVYSTFKTNWQGIGVKPDLDIDPEQALYTAHTDALKKLIDLTEDNQEKDRFQWALDGVKAMHEPYLLTDDLLLTYAGVYGNRAVYNENGILYYQYKDRPKRKMIAVSEDYFIVENYDMFRVKIIKKNKKVTGLQEVFTDGSVMQNSKDD